MTVPKEGDLFATQISGWVGRGIYAAQIANGTPPKWAKWTHVGIYMGDGKVLEAEPGGAVISPLSRYDGRPMLWSTGLYELTDQQRHQMMNVAVTLVGTPYSYLDYGSIALHRLHVRPDWVEDYIQSTHHMICSQMGDYVWNQAGVHLFEDNRLEQDVTPGDIGQLFTLRRAALSVAG